VEFKKIGLIGEMPPKNWCDDSDLLDIFIDTIKNISNLRYLHFIGGETLITPAFQTILEALISAGLNHRVSIGFTTGLTLWKESTVDLLKQFKEVNLGLSIECFHPTNDYVRYGTNIDQAKEYISRWLEISKELGWLTQIRTTPTILSVWHLDTVYEYAWQNQLSVESCNFLTRPDFMRPSVLPSNLRLVVINKLKKWVSDKTISTAESVLNTRNPEFYQHQLIQDAESYIDYLSKQQDESHRAIDLVVYLKKLEDSRGNHILDYLPEYESFLRSAGY
jgi:sulfatase maturation enzyme AslB (radical SAM superfamily)